MKDPKETRELAVEPRRVLLGVLQARFEQNPGRHPGLDWKDVRGRLATRPGSLWSLSQMEETGGEPDLVGQDKRTGEFIFMDCAPESPAGRTGLCYDRQALEARKEFKPRGSACDLAAAMGIELLTEAEYRALQELGSFDEKSSSWLRAPADIRKKGGALFGDRRYGRVFVYHNGAQSYYAGRGFRGSLRV